MAEFDYEYDWTNRESKHRFLNHLNENLHKQIFGDKTPDVNMFKEQVARYLDEMVKESKTISDYEITSTEVNDSKITFTISYQKV